MTINHSKAEVVLLTNVVYLQMVLLFGIVASGTVTNFFPTVVDTLGYKPVVSLLLTSPPYVLAVIASYLNAMHADKTGERYWHITLPLWLSVVAFIIAATTHTIGPRYFSMMLMVRKPNRAPVGAG